MANNSTPYAAPTPFKAIQDANKHLIKSPPQEYDDLINTLPFKSFGSHRLRLYQDFWIPATFLRGSLAMQDNFQCRQTDLFLASYPKSGTTWLKALMFATMTRDIYPLDQHPLRTNNPHECISIMETVFSTGRSSLIEALPSPRILSTHLPYSILPKSIIGSDCKIIYVWRDPKDVLVSQYYFLHDLSSKRADQKAPFDEMFDMFCEGSSGFGPIWNHVLDYWQESITKPEKVLFLKFEEMLQEPVKHLKSLAEFIRCPFSEAEEKQGMVEKIVELCSFRSLKELEVNKTGSWTIRDAQISNAAFFRKGSAGDWRNHMTPEMAQRLDGILKDKFEKSGLLSC